MLRFYHLQARCESWALMGFSKGIEYRYPLLDRRIIEYMLTVPTLLLCRTAHFRPLLREIGEGIIPDEVRWQWEKRDPVYRRWMDDHFRMAAERYMNEVDHWRSDRDLSFADLDLLVADIQRFRVNTESVNGKALFRAIVYFKAIHGFTKEYHDR
jgi:asparagine synthase (glutamine-hydrolysing)